MARIRVKNGPHKGAEFEIQDESLVIGRDEHDNGIQVLDQGVSRRHAEIFRIGEMFFIRDLGSRNGTYVNEEKVSEELLRVGDEVKIGSTLMVFEDKRGRGPREENGQSKASGEADTFAATTVINIHEAACDEDLVLDPSKETQESRDLQVLYQVAKTVASERDVRDLCERLVKLSVEAVGADHGYAFIRHPERGEITLFASHDKQGKQAPMVSKNIIRRVLKFGRAVLSSDASTDDRFRDHGSVVMKQIRSVVCAPLVTTDELAGVLYLATSKLAEAFSSEDLELITAIGIQAGMAIQGLKLQQSVESNYLDLVGALVAAVELQNPEARGAGESVASYASGIAQALGLSGARNRRIQLAAMLHNIGRLFLGGDELKDDKTIGESVEVATRFVERVDGMSFLLPAIRHQHERYDGAGLPDKLKAEDIPLEARILAAARDFSQLLAGAEKSGVDPRTAHLIETLRGDVGHYDPRVLDAIERAHSEGWLYDPKERVDVT